MAHPKGVLLERAAKLGHERPQFRTEQTGPEHEPVFIADVIVAGEVLGTGQGGSKRTAETRAAEEALLQLDAREPGAKATRERSNAKSGGRSKRGASSQTTTSAKPSVEANDVPDREDEMASEEFDGPWPMFDDLLAATLEVAERRVNADLRGEEARKAIRDFSLSLYKELLSELGDVVEEDDEGEDED